MFLNPKILKKLLKEAYKHRTLYLACKAESLYIAAGYWEMEFLKEYIPKETLGDIVALSGMLPEDGQRAFEQKYTREEFMKMFGKNYLEE